MMRGTKFGFENDRFEIEDDDNDESYKNEDDEEEEEAEDTAEENNNNHAGDDSDDDDDENDEDHKPGRSGSRRKTRGTGTRGRGRGRGRGSRGGRSRAGRPRSNNNNGNKQQATSEEQSNFLDALLSLGQAMLLKPEDEKAGTDASADAPTKRKRGRPKKVTQENASEAPSIAPAPDTLSQLPAIISNNNTNNVDQDKMDEDAHFNNIAQILAQAPTILAQKMEEKDEPKERSSPRPASTSQQQDEMEAIAAILNTQSSTVKRGKKPRKKRVLENRMLTERQQMKMLKQIYPNMEISSSSSEDEQSTGSEGQEDEDEEEEDKKPEKQQEKQQQQQQQQPRRRQRKSLKDSNDESDDNEEEKKNPATETPAKPDEKKPQRRGRKPKTPKKEEEKKPTTNGRAASPERKPVVPPTKPATSSKDTTTTATPSTPASKSTATTPQPVWIDCGKTTLKCRDVTVGIVNVYKKDAKLELQTTDSLNINKRIPLDKLLLIAPSMLNMLYFDAPSAAEREKLEQIYAALLRDNMAGVVSLPDCLLLFIPYKSKLMASLEVKDDKRLMGAVFRLHEEGKVVLKSEPAPIKNEEKPIIAAPAPQQQPAAESTSAPTLPPPEVMSILSSLNLSSDQMNNVLGLMQKVGAPATAPATTVQQAIRTTSPNSATPYVPPTPLQTPATPILASSLPIQPPIMMQQQSPMMAHAHQQSPMPSPMQQPPFMQAPMHHSPMQSPIQQHPSMMDYRRAAVHPPMTQTHMIDSTQTLHPAPPQPHNIGVPPPPVGVPPPPPFANFIPGIGVPPPPQGIPPTYSNQLPTRAQSPGLKRKREDDDLSPDAKKRRLYQEPYYEPYDMKRDQDRASRSPSPGYMNDGYNSSMRGGRRNGPPNNNNKFRRDYEYSGYANKFGNYGRDYNQPQQQQQQQQGYARHDNYVRYSNRPQQQQQQQHMYRDALVLNEKQDYYKSAPPTNGTIPAPANTTTTTTSPLPPPNNSMNPSMVPQDNRYQHHQYPYHDKKQNYDRFTEQQTPTRHLWIGRFNRNNIDYDVIMQDFSKYGEVESCNYLRDQKCAFVNFKRLEDAERAKRHLEGAKYPKVEFQRSKPPKDIKDSLTMHKKSFDQHGAPDEDMDTS